MSLSITRSLADFRRDFIGSAIDPDRRRGRGAVTNRSGRFEGLKREAVDDGWGNRAMQKAEQDGERELGFKTEVTIEKAKSIITKNDSPDISFDRSVNPYRGCEHGCAYCFARPTHAFMGLSPGLDFETKLFAKANAAELLERELTAPGYEPKTIAMGTNTDPYQPIERTHRITRALLEVMAKMDHPVGIVTKSALVTRDIDILAPMAAKGLAKVAISITTLDRKLSRDLEPRAATPEKRLETIRQLSQAGIPVTVLVAPVIPGINDHEIEAILEAAKAAARPRLAMCCSACRSRFATCSANGCSTRRRASSGTSCRWCSRRAAARITMRAGASARPAPGPSPGSSAGASSWPRTASASTASG